MALLNPIKGCLAIVLISLMAMNSIKLNAQSFFNVFGVNEFSTGVLKYDSANSALSGYIMKNSLGQNPQRDSNTLLYRAEWDRNLQLLGTELLVTPSISPYHYFGLRDIENWNEKILVYRVDPSNQGSVPDFFPFASNCDLCNLVNDSLINCLQLLPDSAFNMDILGVYNDADTLHLIASYAFGSADTIPEIHHVRIAKSTLAISTKVSYFFENGMGYYPFGNPIKLPNGNWFVRMAQVNTQYTRVIYGVIDAGWNNALNIIEAGSSFSSFNKAWVFNGKLVFVNGEMSDPLNWNPSDPIKEQVTLIEYDYQQDSITNRYHFDFSSKAGNISHHTIGYSALFNGQYFVLAAQRADDFLLSGPPDATILVAVDTTFKIASQMILEDTIKAVTPWLDAVINGLTQGANPKEFYYMGYVHDPDVNTGNYSYDIMLGKLDLNNIGTEEYIKVRHQQTWLYPNPTSGVFKLTNTAVPFKPYAYKVLDVTGKLMLTGRADTEKQVVHVNLPHGTYYLSTEQGDVLPFVVE